jgi:hypothetical protein
MDLTNKEVELILSLLITICFLYIPWGFILHLVWYKDILEYVLWKVEGAFGVENKYIKWLLLSLKFIFQILVSLISFGIFVLIAGYFLNLLEENFYIN